MLREVSEFEVLADCISEAECALGYNVRESAIAMMSAEARVDSGILDSIINQQYRGYRTIEFGVPVILPIKRHRKKRIQKKWIKKYGVTVEYIRVTAVVKESKVAPREPGCLSYEMSVDSMQTRGINKLKESVLNQCRVHLETMQGSEIGEWI